jgi:ankyrin repeat protein
VHFVKVRLLKNDGINPNFRRCLQSAPLALAARGGHSAVVELLLAIATAYIDLNVRDLLQSDVSDVIGVTPLIYSYRNGNISIVR